MRYGRIRASPSSATASASGSRTGPRGASSTAFALAAQVQQRPHRRRFRASQTGRRSRDDKRSTCVGGGKRDVRIRFGWMPSGASVSVVSRRCHGGRFCARVGASTRTKGDSNLAQRFTAPTGVTRLSFFYEVVCTDTVRFDWATAKLRDNTAGFARTVLRKTCTNTGRYVQAVAAVTAGALIHADADQSRRQLPGRPHLHAVRRREAGPARSLRRRLSPEAPASAPAPRRRAYRHPRARRSGPRSP